MFNFFGILYDATGFVTTACFFVVLVYLVSYVKKTKRLPPGPIGLPVLGYVPFLTEMPHLKMWELAAKYGNVFSMRLGSGLFVVLNKGNVIREAFSKPELLGRPTTHFFSMAKKFETPFFSNGRTWQEQRRFAVHTMRDLGFGKSWMEKHILEEIQFFLEVISESDGLPIKVKENLTPSMSNNICSLVFGYRYRYDDPRRIFLDETLDYVARSTQILTPMVFFPWLKRIPFIMKMLEKAAFSKKFDRLIAFVGERIDEHEKTLDPNSNRDFIDGYLTEMKNRLQKDPQTTFSRNMLTGSVIGLFGAGSETVRTTVDWSLYALAVFHDVQKKVQAEIDEIIGKERMPSWQDHKEMPFTQAVLTEVQRWKTVAPLGIPRCALEDTELQGYHIPKGTTVIANIWSAHHDPDVWDNPDQFMPDRFVSKDGKSFVRTESFIPFSVGKRSCPGETLALIEMFLYITSILQRFTVEVSKQTIVDFEGRLGITYHAKPHMLCFKRRP